MRLINAVLIQYEPMLSPKGNGMYEDVMVAYKSQINDLPTIEERKKGKWIDMGDFEQCSVCLGTRLKEVQTFYGKAIWIKTDFCPNCGADMRKEIDDEDNGQI